MKAQSPEEEEEEETQTPRFCCLSHEFFRAASANPNKTAVIHASGVAHLSTRLRQTAHPFPPPASSNFNHDNISTLLEQRVESLSPPVYNGDRCFTYSHLLKAVDSLASRISSILLGADDPHLITPKPQGDNAVNHEKGTIYAAENLETNVSSSESVVDSSEEYRPKIVGIYMPPSVEYIVAVLSVLRCGEAFLPLDPYWPKERLLSIVASSSADLIIGSKSSFGSELDELDESHWLVKSVSCPVLSVSIEESLQEYSDLTDLLWPCANEKKRSFCYLMYTSGSTGKPKGVCGTEQGLSNRFLWMQGLYPLNGQESLLFKTSISFVDHLQEFFSAILTACMLVIPPFSVLKENICSIIDFLQAYSINRLTAVPSLMKTILPGLQTHVGLRVQSSLKLLLLSGELFPLTLWEKLSTVLPNTFILNLYGSTEVSGDCTYFDCKRMPLVLKEDMLTSVPIGLPIYNCDVVLLCENASSKEGELYVGGSCISRGYYTESNMKSENFVKLPQSYWMNSMNDCKSKLYFRTGDFVKQLSSGDFVFLGRKDRIVKINGHRIALEEIEDLLRKHPYINDAAVICRNIEELLLLEAFIILEDKERLDESLIPAIRSWMISKLPSAVVPNYFIFVDSFPVSSSGKVNYELLVDSRLLTMNVKDKVVNIDCSSLLRRIQKAFHDALMVEKVCNDDDFFTMGGNSLSAAHVAHSLGIDMRFLYYHPSPFKLCMALLQKRGSCALHNKLDDCFELITERQDNHVSSNHIENSNTHESWMISKGNDDNSLPSKRLKRGITDVMLSADESSPWHFSPIFESSSFSRCNKVLHKGQPAVTGTQQTTWLANAPRGSRGHIKDCWKVYMESCVDASPMLVSKGSDIYLFIGSHSHKFLCINARSGSVQWEIKLDGRVECTAAIVSDFSQVVVGCYMGKIYFLDFSSGTICWSFQTSGEVKSQPVVDTRRHLIWCGSHDHNLYALDYKNHCCVYKLPCGGSIFGSPVIDEVRGLLYVASTGGRITAISISDFSFTVLWLNDLEVPIFGSLGITEIGTVICCLVDGHVLALDPNGSTVWKQTTDGPIFSGPCMPSTLPHEVLVCSRKGSVYSFKPENGDLLWKHNVGDPITSSAYVDEHLQLVSDDASHSSDRLICICSSSGRIHLLRENLNSSDDTILRKIDVQEFARLDLLGDIFSSPLMIGGRIFVGCRDDYLHCVTLEMPKQHES
ncbi:putative acyl-activating enzyme 19 isoform X1 [Arachis duranensis]|uniref:Acyl-activating enzyme 19 isoform X1 n=1 Tax=Arachis duranensis TaxID=130453 RepID=A0A6P4CHH5_ARADU|nr:putative acyl-activating enzyme 19 isoform X1 [Arachis duranensis]